MKEHPFHRLHRLRMENDEHAGKMDELAPRFQRLRDRHENGTAAKPVVSFNLFQTPPDLARRMADALAVEPEHTLLEPSVGLGRLLDAVTDTVTPKHVTVCDISADCLAVVYQKHESAAIKQGDFLGRDLGKFDRIIMNPPFKMRRDIKHILHAYEHLKEGGRLVALCMDGYQRAEKLQHLCTDWVEIPAGTFKSEGTNVPTIMLTIDK